MDFDEFRENSGEEWIAAAAIAAGVFVGLLLLRWLAVRLTERGPQVGAATARDLFAALERRTHPVIIVLVALFAGSRVLTFPDEVDEVVRAVTIVSLLVQGGLWGSAAITYMADWYQRRDPDAAIAGALDAGRYVGMLVLWSLLFILALDNIGVQVTALVAGLGIGGIAIALAAQSVLGDLFASLAIVLDRPFAVGDFIIVDDMLGTVEKIGIKTTRVRSLSGEQLVFGNNDLLSSRIRNYGRMEQRRVVFTLGVTYDTATELVEMIPEMVREAIESQPLTRFDRAHFNAYGDSALSIEAVYYVLSADYGVYMDIQQAINLQVLRRFRATGIEFAFPTQTVYVYGQRLPAAAGGCRRGAPSPRACLEGGRTRLAHCGAAARRPSGTIGR